MTTQVKAKLTEQDVADRWEKISGRRYLTPAEVVKLWDGAVTIGTLANWRNKGEGPAFIKFGVRVRYAVADLKRWEQDNKHHANDNEP